VNNVGCYFGFLRSNTGMGEVVGMSDVENKLDVNCHTLVKLSSAWLQIFGKCAYGIFVKIDPSVKQQHGRQAFCFFV
jgi:hypothetical protein